MAVARDLEQREIPPYGDHWLARNITVSKNSASILLRGLGGRRESTEERHGSRRLDATVDSLGTTGGNAVARRNSRTKRGVRWVIPKETGFCPLQNAGID
jgi:hypothetical protein